MGRLLAPAAPLLLAALVAPATAQHLDAAGGWLAYADVAEAGYDSALLEEARAVWEASDSAAFLVLDGGAVVASWGDVERRYMCHSVRKSYLSALFGPYVEEGVVDLDATLAELGIDDTTPLTDAEKQATVLQLMQARSGVFLPAAYEPAQNPKPPRGTAAPGEVWCYNNWDFNALVTIFNRVTGEDFFSALDARLMQPLGTQDWRISDGYYHHQPDMSAHPAYPLRMSGRDMARLGQLFLQDGRWLDTQVLPASWVERCRTSCSDDTWMGGYGLMWWVFEDNPLAQYGTYAAMGVGQQLIAVLPALDMVIVNRTDTYAGDRPSLTEIAAIALAVDAARVGERVAEPRLVPLAPVVRATPAARAVDVDLRGFEGTFIRPPASFGLEADGEVTLSVRDGQLVLSNPHGGTFGVTVLDDGTWLVEDSHARLVPWYEDGVFVGPVGWEPFVSAGYQALVDDDLPRARALLATAHERFPVRQSLLGAGALVAMLDDDMAPERLAGVIPDDAHAQLADEWLGLVEDGLREEGNGAQAFRVGLLRRRVLALHAEPEGDETAVLDTAGDDATASGVSTGPVGVDALVDAYVSAYVAGDVDALAAHLAEGAEFEDPTMRLLGRDAIRDGLAQVFGDLVIESFDEQRRMRSGARHVLLDGRVRFHHGGEAFGHAGRLQFDLEMVVLLEVADGEVHAHLDLVDSTAYAEQLREQLAGA